MKIAIISDVHGNYPALVNVVADARSNNVDQFVFTGDYIFDLPYSNDVVHLIMNTNNACVIKGNKETYLVSLSKDDQKDWVYDQIGGIYQTFRDLSNDVINYLLGLKEEAYLPLDNGEVLYATHYLKNTIQKIKQTCSSSGYHRQMLTAPFTHEQFLGNFHSVLMQEDLRKEIGSINASVIVFGHNHLQGYGYVDGKLIINPGSCGQPLDFNPEAAYTILETTQNGYAVTEKRVAFDIDSIINHTKESLLYINGKIWTELVLLSLRTGRDYYGFFFETAQKIADLKGEKGQFFSNETWKEAYDSFPFF